MIVVVTGLMRTGTSLLAKQLHELGVPMGSEMRFPSSGPLGQLDWEDLRFTDRCVQSLIKGEGSPGTFFNEYIDSRTDPLWGIKTPFLLPYLSTFTTAAKRRGHEVKVITTFRPFMDTITSLRTQLPDDDSMFNAVKAIQDKLIVPARQLSLAADLVVDIEDSWTNPEEVKQRLSDLIGRSS